MSVRSELIQKKAEVIAKNGMVVAECVEAADAGLEIFEKGGNAVDAAVATAFASCTCEPAMASLGGGGAALIHLTDAKRTTAVEFEGRLSKSATEEMFVDDLLPLGVDPHPSFGWRGTRNSLCRPSMEKAIARTCSVRPCFYRASLVAKFFVFCSAGAIPKDWRWGWHMRFRWRCLLLLRLACAVIQFPKHR